MYQNKKAFTLIELLMGVIVMSILLSVIVKIIVPYTKIFIQAQENVTGRIYILAYDIEKNKINTKKSEILNNGKSLRFYMSQTCYFTYTFNNTKKEMKKTIDCSEKEMKKGYITLNIPNIDFANFSKKQKTIYLNIREKGQNYNHSFVF